MHVGGDATVKNGAITLTTGPMVTVDARALRKWMPKRNHSHFKYLELIRLYRLR